MAGPIDWLRQGIQEKKWSLIAKAYRSLSGEKITVGKGPDAVEEDEVKDVPSLPTNVRPPRILAATESTPIPELPPSRRMPDFRVQNNVPGRSTRGEDGMRACRVLPFEPKPNTFVDKKTLARADIKVDKLLTAGLEPSERRQAVSTELVEAECVGCHRIDQVEPYEANKTLEGEASSYLCIRCLKESRERQR